MGESEIVNVKGRNTEDVFDGAVSISIPREVSSSDERALVRVGSPWSVNTDEFLEVGETIHYQDADGYMYYVKLEQLGSSITPSRFKVIRRMTLNFQDMTALANVEYENKESIDRSNQVDITVQLEQLKDELIEAFASQHEQHAKYINQQVEQIIFNLKGQGVDQWKHTTFTSLLSILLTLDVSPSEKAIFWAMVKQKFGEVVLALPSV